MKRSGTPVDILRKVLVPFPRKRGVTRHLGPASGRRNEDRPGRRLPRKKRRCLGLWVHEVVKTELISFLKSRAGFQLRK